MFPVIIVMSDSDAWVSRCVGSKHISADVRTE
jgi:hypothetical protein